MLNSKTEGERVTGEFTVPGGRKVFGSLHINGDESKLSLFDDKPLPAAPEDYDYLEGELHDGRLVSLIEGVRMKSSTRFAASGSRKHSYSIFPHFITLGPAHVDPSHPCIKEISFGMEDATSIFHDFEAFSSVLDVKSIAPILEESISESQPVKFGEHPTIAYFTGNFEIATIDTLLGQVRAEHRPSMTPEGPKGLRMDNTILVTLQPPEPVVFRDAIASLQTLLRFFGLIAGRHQALNYLMVTINGQKSASINIHRSFDASPQADDPDNSALHPKDVLITTLDDKAELENALTDYLRRDHERHDGRIRLHNSFSDPNHYTIDRLVAAANMFDILPNTIYPSKTELAAEVLTAKNEAKKLFRALPPSIEKDSMLNALGRIGHLSLKHKIISRVTSTCLDRYLPGLNEVLKEAVNCRNHYVHGSPGRIDYANNSPLVMFFTDALEFSFAASDLIDCGWEFSKWRDGSPLHRHPFAKFVSNYQSQLKQFQVVMAE